MKKPKLKVIQGGIPFDAPPSRRPLKERSPMTIEMARKLMDVNLPQEEKYRIIAVIFGL